MEREQYGKQCDISLKQFAKDPVVLSHMIFASGKRGVQELFADYIKEILKACTKRCTRP